MGNPTDPVDGALIAGRYRVREELARGGMGVVYSVLDTSTNRPVALKRLLANAASNKHISNLFQREYHTLVQLQHPRIIEVYDYGVDRDGAYYTMELLDGKDLREIAPLGYVDACRHLRDVASSLALLHARRLIHRDLSARNVRLTSDERAKVLDFGALATFGVSGQIVGTPPIVPPEALSGKPLDQRSDLYALGALAYGLLTGRYAYPAQNLQMLPGLWQKGPPPPPSKLIKDVPRELDQLIMSLLSLDVMSRPSSAAEVIERLNVIAGLESEELLEVGHSYLSNPKVVGREREMERLRRLLERVVRGRSVSLLIEGEPGVGKTRLIEEAAVEAQLRGAVAVRVDAEVQRGPYGVVGGLVSALLVALPELAVKTLSPHAGVLSPVLAEVREKFPDAVPRERSADRSEQRVQIQTALTEWFSAIAAERPLLLMIDNAHAADEASLAFGATIARRSAKKALGILATSRTGEEVTAARTLDALRDASDVMALGGLSAAHTIDLAHALFGHVDNAGRLGQWLCDHTDGNPMQCLALAAQLIAENHITYKDGAWVLPAELSREKWASGMTQVLERRVAQLSHGARQLAESISIERGKFSIEQCRALSGAEGNEIFSWLDELIQKGMLVSVGDEYRFSQVALQKHLRERLPESRKKELHRRAGDYLLAKPDVDAFGRIDAGWHFLHAGEESRGADLLAIAGSGLVTSIEGIALAAPGLEVALQVFEKERRSKYAILNVLEALTAAGWYVDRRYAVKYGERSLDLAMELSGLRLAGRLSPVLGQKLSVQVGTIVAAIRHGLMKSRIDVERFKDFKGLFAPLIATLAIMVGVAANGLDPKSARRLLDAARMMSAFPSNHIVAVMYDYCRFLTLSTEGHFAEAKPFGLRVLEWFKGDEATKIIGPGGAKALTGGQMTSLALYSAMTSQSEALKWAEQLEALGLSFYRLMGTQTRFVYHVLRGEIAQAAPYREQLELNAIQGGTTWQTSILIPSMLGFSYMTTGEVVRLRQCAEELERMKDEIPSLVPTASVFRASYHYWRGRPAQALSALEALSVARETDVDLPSRLIASMKARVLLSSGRAEEAVSVCRRILERIAPDNRRFGIINLETELILSLAQAEMGETDEAARRLDASILEQKQYEVPIVLALLHEARARVAQKSKDAQTAMEHADRMGHWARATENTALVAKWKTLESEVRDRREDRKPESGRRGATPITHYASAIRTILEQHAGMERARAALRLIIENSNAPRGYLYLGSPPNLVLAVQVPEDAAPPQNVTEYVIGLAAAVHQSTSFAETNDLTGTAGVTALGQGSNPIANDLMARLLVVTRAGQPRVVGAVALKLESSAADGLDYEMLDAIAQCLEEVAPVKSISTSRNIARA